MIHHHLIQPPAHPTGQGGDEAVHLPVEVHVLDHLAAVGLQGAAVVVQGHPGDFADQPVGDHGGQLAVDESVFAVFAPAAHHVEALIHAGQQQRDIRRIILQVGIQGDHNVSAGRMETGAHGGRLAKVAAEPDHPQVRNTLGLGHQFRPRAIRAAVVHQHHLVRAVEGRQRGVQLLAQQVYALLLVEDGDDNGYGGNWRC